MSTLPQKPTVNVATIGGVGHGKTTLTDALTRVCFEVFGSAPADFSTIDSAPEDKARGITPNTAHVEYSSAMRFYAHVDCPGHADYAKYMLTGAARLDGAILVVSAAEGPTPHTSEHVRLSRQLGVPFLLVFLNKAETVEDDEALKKIEKKVRALLNAHDFPGDDTPIVIGSALLALNGDDDNGMGTTSVRKLVETLDKHISQPVLAADKPFLMPIEEVLSAPGSDSFVTGRIERGIIKRGEKIEIIGLREVIVATCNDVEISGVSMKAAQAGDNCKLLLSGTKPDDIEPGQLLVMPGTVKPHTQFEAEIYLLSKEEGGRNMPFFKGYRPQFYFRTTDVTGNCELPEGVEMVMPGDNVKVSVTLIKPIAMEDGLRFAIREGGRTVGAGVVSKIMV